MNSNSSLVKCKVGKKTEGGSKKRKEVGNDNSLDSMFGKQQTVSDLNKSRDMYNAQLQKGEEMGSNEAAQVEPVCRLEKDIHDIEGKETVHATWEERMFEEEWPKEDS